MIVDDLDVMRISVSPAKANTPLIVDADTVLSRTFPGKLFQPVTRWNPQKFKIGRSVNLHQFPQGDPLQIGRQPAAVPPTEDLFRLAVGKILDQGKPGSIIIGNSASQN
jgi:hypothetical protein